MVLRLIDALCEAGATVVRRPACARCGRVVTLCKTADGLRICRSCCARARAVPCSGCGYAPRTGRTRRRRAAVVPVLSWSTIRSTGRNAFAAAGDSGSADGRAGADLRRMRPAPISTCSVCGRLVPCRTSTITGQPWCASCSRPGRLCSGCATLAPVRAGTRPPRCVPPAPRRIRRSGRPARRAGTPGVSSLGSACAAASAGASTSCSPTATARSAPSCKPSTRRWSASTGRAPR